MPTTQQLLELGEARSGVGLKGKQFLVPSVPSRPGIARIGRKIVEEHTRYYNNGLLVKHKHLCNIL